MADDPVANVGGTPVVEDEVLAEPTAATAAEGSASVDGSPEKGLLRVAVVIDFNNLRTLCRQLSLPDLPFVGMLDNILDRVREGNPGSSVELSEAWAFDGVPSDASTAVPATALTPKRSATRSAAHGTPITPFASPSVLSLNNSPSGSTPGRGDSSAAGGGANGREEEHRRAREAGILLATYASRRQIGYGANAFVQKEVDVALALKIVELAGGLFPSPDAVFPDVIFVVASDRDFAPAIRTVRAHQPDKQVWICYHPNAMNDAYLAELRHLGVMPANVKQILTHGPEFLAFDEQSGSWKDVLAKIESHLASYDPTTTPPLTLNLSNNRHLNGRRLAEADAVLQRYPAVPLGQIWVHHCRLDDDGMDVLADMVRRYPTLVQIHVSHNRKVTLDGMGALFAAAAAVPRRPVADGTSSDAPLSHLYINARDKRSDLTDRAVYEYLRSSTDAVIHSARVAIRGLYLYPDGEGFDAFVNVAKTGFRAKGKKVHTGRPFGTPSPGQQPSSSSSQQSLYRSSPVALASLADADDGDGDGGSASDRSDPSDDAGDEADDGTETDFDLSTADGIVAGVRDLLESHVPGDLVSLRLDHTPALDDEVLSEVLLILEEAGATGDVSSLYLHHCGLTNAGMDLLAGLVAESPALRELHLSHNDGITPDGLVAVAAAAGETPRSVAEGQRGSHLYINLKWPESAAFEKSALQAVLDAAEELTEVTVAIKGTDEARNADVVINVYDENYRRGGGGANRWKGGGQGRGRGSRKGRGGRGRGRGRGRGGGGGGGGRFRGGWTPPSPRGKHRKKNKNKKKGKASWGSGDEVDSPTGRGGRRGKVHKKGKNKRGGGPRVVDFGP